MPRAWRIVKEKYVATAFSGEGALKFGGRWNSRGVPMVYTSGTKALAALELLAHLNPPVYFKLAAIPVEFDEVLIETLVGADLPQDWQTEPPGASTQRLGDAWARKARSIVLAVPSAIIPGELNYLLNPAHPDFYKLKIGKPELFSLDPRLMRKLV